MRGPFVLGSELDFPSPLLADENGLLAIGGDLAPERLLSAYRRGIFPWPLMGEGFPMLWWSPDPRCVLYPGEFRANRSLRRSIRRGIFEIRFDQAFSRVVSQCAGAPRAGQDGTWITQELIEAYGELHRLGFAHSVESYLEGELVGGLYGVALGSVFFGESMFATESDASKVALAALVERLVAEGFDLIDCQQESEYLRGFGARPIPAARFLKQLSISLAKPDRVGRWAS